MNLVEKLLKADKEKTKELERGTVKSKRLAKILGEEEPVIVEIQEIPARTMNDILAQSLNENGKFDFENMLDNNAMTLVEGVISPNLKDDNLIQHFDCATPKDLAIRLFGNEVTSISDAIINISEENEEKKEKKEKAIKN